MNRKECVDFVAHLIVDTRSSYQDAIVQLMARNPNESSKYCTGVYLSHYKQPRAGCVECNCCDCVANLLYVDVMRRMRELMGYKTNGMWHSRAEQEQEEEQECQQLGRG